MEKSEVILKACAAGGSVTLYGVRTNHGWLFSRQVIDQTPELIDEPWVQHKSEVVDTWQAALELMDRYRWHKLYPREIHSEFKELVWAALVSRYELESDEELILKYVEMVCAVRVSNEKQNCYLVSC